jgi:putative transcriptional regulator
VKSWKRWLYLIAALAAVFVAVASAVQAIRQGSWAPVISVAWLPAVIVAAWPGSGRRCLPRRRHPAGWAARGMKNKVRALRMGKNLAQGQLAEAMGVSRQTINSIENERYTPSLPLALALARYFGVTVEEMFDEQGL